MNRGFGRKRSMFKGASSRSYVLSKNGGVTSTLRRKLDFKLHQLHYDILPNGYVPSGSSDGNSVSYVGSYRLSDTTKAHGVLWSNVGSEPFDLRPSDRTGVYGTGQSNPLGAIHQFSMASLAPFYEHFEFMNVSSVGCYVTVPYVVRWNNREYVNPGSELMSSFGAVANTLCDQVAIAEGTPPFLTQMYWHNGLMSTKGVSEAFGVKNLEFSHFKYGTYMKVQKKKWKAYLPPGGVFRIRVRVPGIKTLLAENFVSGEEFRYGDFGLVILTRSDCCYANLAGDPTGADITNPKQCLAMRRTSSSISVVSEYECGRVGFLTNTFKRFGTISGNTYAAVPVAPAFTQKLDANQAV